MKDKKIEKLVEEDISKEDTSKDEAIKNKEKELPGYPPYPPKEDIYKTDKEETDLDPEDPTKTKPVDETKGPNEKDFNQDKTGKDLDVPGEELDDELEEIGSEDEENNLYSLGGERHEDLEEDKGD
jgi:hypothetical protein